MSKTTPEEAIALAAKHNVWLWMADDERFKRLASLIDEARGVDAEPFMHVYEFASPFGGTVWRDSPDMWNGNQPKRSLPLYTRPAPSQPAAPVELPVAWTPGPNEFKDWCSRWFGPDSDDDYLAKAVFNLPLMAQKFENTAPSPELSALPIPVLPVEALRTLAKELDGELHSGAKWTEAQHTCNSVSGALLDIANKLSDAQAAIAAGRKAS